MSVTASRMGRRPAVCAAPRRSKSFARTCLTIPSAIAVLLASVLCAAIPSAAQYAYTATGVGNAATGGALATAVDVDVSNGPLAIDSIAITVFANASGPYTLALSLNSTEAGAPLFGIQSFPAVSLSQTFSGSSLRRPVNLTFTSSNLGGASGAAWPPIFFGGRYTLVLSCTSGCPSGAWGTQSQLAWLPHSNATFLNAASSNATGPVPAMRRGGTDKIFPLGGLAQSSLGVWGSVTIPPLSAFFATRTLNTLVDTTRGLTSALGATPAGSPWTLPAVRSSTSQRAAALIMVSNSTTSSGWPSVALDVVTVLVSTTNVARDTVSTEQLTLFAVSPTTLLPTTSLTTAVTSSWAANVAAGDQSSMAITFNTTSWTTSLVPGQLYALVLSTTSTNTDYWRAADPSLCDGNGTSPSNPAIRVLGVLNDAPGWSVKVANMRDYASCPAVFIAGRATPAALLDYSGSISAAAASTTTAGAAVAAAPALYPSSASSAALAVSFDMLSAATGVYSLGTATLGLAVSMSAGAGSHVLNVSIAVWTAGIGDGKPATSFPFSSGSQACVTTMNIASSAQAVINFVQNITVSFDRCGVPPLLASGGRYALSVAVTCATGNGCSDSSGNTLTIRWAAGSLMTIDSPAERALAAATKLAFVPTATAAAANVTLITTPASMAVAVADNSVSGGLRWTASPTSLVREFPTVAPALRIVPLMNAGGGAGPRRVYFDTTGLLQAWDPLAPSLPVGSGSASAKGALALPFSVPVSARAARLGEVIVMVTGASGGAASDGMDAGLTLTATLWAAAPEGGAIAASSSDAPVAVGAPTVRLLRAPPVSVLVTPAAAASASVSAPLFLSIKTDNWPLLSAGSYAIVLTAAPALTARFDGGPLPSADAAFVFLAAAADPLAVLTPPPLALGAEGPLAVLRTAMRQKSDADGNSVWLPTPPADAAYPAVILLGGPPTLIEGATASNGLGEMMPPSLFASGIGPAVPRVDTSFSLSGWAADSQGLQSLAPGNDPLLAAIPLGVTLGPDTLGRAAAILLAVDGSVAGGGGALFLESFSIMVTAPLGPTSEGMGGKTITASLWSVDANLLLPKRKLIAIPQLTSAPIPNSLAGGKPVVVSFHPGAVGGWPAFTRGRFAIVFTSTDTTGSVRWVSAAQPYAAAASDALATGIRVIGGSVMVPGTTSVWRFAAGMRMSGTTSTTPSASAVVGISSYAAFTYASTITGIDPVVAPNAAALVSPAWSSLADRRPYTGSPLGTFRLLASSALLLYDGTDGGQRITANYRPMASCIYLSCSSINQQSSAGAVFRVTAASPIRLTRVTFWIFGLSGWMTNANLDLQVMLADPSTGLPLTTAGATLATVNAQLPTSLAATITATSPAPILASFPSSTPLIPANATIAIIARYKLTTNVYCLSDASTLAMGGQLTMLGGIQGVATTYTRAAPSLACAFMIVGAPVTIQGADTRPTSTGANTASTFNLTAPSAASQTSAAVGTAISFASDPDRASMVSSAEVAVVLPAPGMWRLSATFWNASAGSGGRPIAPLMTSQPATALAFGPPAAVYPLTTTVVFNWTTVTTPLRTDESRWDVAGGERSAMPRFSSSTPLAPLLVPASAYSLVIAVESAPSVSSAYANAGNTLALALSSTMNATRSIAAANAAGSSPFAVMSAWNGSALGTAIPDWSRLRNNMTPSVVLQAAPPSYFLVDTAAGCNTIASASSSAAAADASGVPLTDDGISIAFAIPSSTAVQPTSISLVLRNTGQTPLIVAVAAVLFAADRDTGLPTVAATNAGNSTTILTVPAGASAATTVVRLSFIGMPVVTGGATASVVITSNVTSGALLVVPAPTSDVASVQPSVLLTFLRASRRLSSGKWAPLSVLPAITITGSPSQVPGWSGGFVVADNTAGGLLLNAAPSDAFLCPAQGALCRIAVLIELPADAVYQIESVTVWGRSQYIDDSGGTTAVSDSGVSFDLYDVEPGNFADDRGNSDDSSVAPAAYSLTRNPAPTFTSSSDERTQGLGIMTAGWPDDLTGAATGAGITPLRWTSLSKGVSGDGSGGLLLPPLRGRVVALVFRAMVKQETISLLPAVPVSGDATGKRSGLPCRIIGGMVNTTRGWSPLSTSNVPAITIAARPMGAVALDNTRGFTRSSSDAFISPSPPDNQVKITFRTDPYDDVKLTSLYLMIGSGNNVRNCLIIDIPTLAGSNPAITLCTSASASVHRIDLSGWSTLPKNSTQTIQVYCAGSIGSFQCGNWGTFIYQSLSFTSNYTVDGFFTMLGGHSPPGSASYPTYWKRMPAMMLLAETPARASVSADVAALATGVVNPPTDANTTMSLALSSASTDGSSLSTPASSASAGFSSIAASFLLDDSDATAAFVAGATLGAGSDVSTQPIAPAFSVLNVTVWLNVTCPGAFRVSAALWAVDPLTFAPTAPLVGVSSIIGRAVLSAFTAASSNIGTGTSNASMVIPVTFDTSKAWPPPSVGSRRALVLSIAPGSVQPCSPAIRITSLASISARLAAARRGALPSTTAVTSLALHTRGFSPSSAWTRVAADASAGDGGFAAAHMSIATSTPQTVMLDTTGELAIPVPAAATSGILVGPGQPTAAQIFSTTDGWTPGTSRVPTGYPLGRITNLCVVVAVTTTPVTVAVAVELWAALPDLTPLSPLEDVAPLKALLSGSADESPGVPRLVCFTLPPHYRPRLAAAATYAVVLRSNSTMRWLPAPIGVSPRGQIIARGVMRQQPGSSMYIPVPPTSLAGSADGIYGSSGSLSLIIHSEPPRPLNGLPGLTSRTQVGGSVVLFDNSWGGSAFGPYNTSLPLTAGVSGTKVAVVLQPGDGSGASWSLDSLTVFLTRMSFLADANKATGSATLTAQLYAVDAATGLPTTPLAGAVATLANAETGVAPGINDGGQAPRTTYALTLTGSATVQSLAPVLGVAGGAAPLAIVVSLADPNFQWGWRAAPDAACNSAGYRGGARSPSPAGWSSAFLSRPDRDNGAWVPGGCLAITVTGKRLGGGGPSAPVLAFDNTRGATAWGVSGRMIVQTDGAMTPTAVILNHTGTAPMELTRVFLWVASGTGPTYGPATIVYNTIWLELWSVSSTTGLPVAALADWAATSNGANSGTRTNDPLPPSPSAQATSPLLVSWSIPPGWWPALQPGQRYALALKGMPSPAGALYWITGAGGSTGGSGTLAVRGSGLLSPVGYAQANALGSNTWASAGGSLTWTSSSYWPADSSTLSLMVYAGPPSSINPPMTGRPALDSINYITAAKVTASNAGIAVGPVGSQATPFGLGFAVLFSTPAGNSSDMAWPLSSVSVVVNVTAPSPYAAVSAFTLSASIYDTARGSNGIYTPTTPLPGFAPVSAVFYTRLNNTGIPQRLIIPIPAGAWPPLPASPSRPLALLLTSSDASARITIVFGAASATTLPSPSAATLSSYGFTFVGVAKRLGVAGWSPTQTGPLPALLLTAGLPLRVVMDTTGRLSRTAISPLTLPPALPLGPDVNAATAALIAGDGQTTLSSSVAGFRGVGAVAFVFKAGALPVVVTSITAIVIASIPGDYAISATLLAGDYWSRLPSTELANQPLGPRVTRSVRIDIVGSPLAVTLELDANTWPTLQMNTYAFALSANDSTGGLSWLMAGNETSSLGSGNVTWYGGLTPLGMGQQMDSGGYAVAAPPTPAGPMVGGADAYSSLASWGASPPSLLPSIYVSGFTPRTAIGNYSVLADTVAGGTLASSEGFAVGSPGEIPGAVAMSFVVDANSTSPLALETVTLPLLLSSRASGVNLRMSLYTADATTGLPTSNLTLFTTINTPAASSVDMRGSAGWRSASMTAFWPQVGRWPLLWPGSAYALVVSTLPDTSTAGAAGAAATSPIIWAFAANSVQNPGPIRLLTASAQLSRVGGFTWRTPVASTTSSRTSSSSSSSSSRQVIPAALLTGAQPGIIYDNTAGLNRILLNGVAGVVPASGSAYAAALMLSIPTGATVFLDRVVFVGRPSATYGDPTLNIRTIADVGSSKRSPTTTSIASYPTLTPISTYSSVNATASGGDGYTNAVYTFDTSSWPALPAAASSGLGFALTIVWPQSSCAVVFPGPLAQTSVTRHPNVSYIGFATLPTSGTVWSQEPAAGTVVQGNALLLSLRESFIPAAPSKLPSASNTPSSSPTISVSPTSSRTPSGTPTSTASSSVAASPTSAATVTVTATNSPKASPSPFGGPSGPPAVLSSYSSSTSSSAYDKYGYSGLVFTSSATGGVFSLDIQPYGGVTLYDDTGAPLGSCGSFAGFLLSADNKSYAGQTFGGGSICYPSSGGAPVRRSADVTMGCAPVPTALSVDLTADGCGVVARVAGPLFCGFNLTVGAEGASASATVTPTAAPANPGPPDLATALLGSTFSGSGMTFTWNPPTALGTAYTFALSITPYGNISAVISLPPGQKTPSGATSFVRDYGTWNGGFLSNGVAYTGQKFDSGSPCPGGGSSSSCSADVVYVCDSSSLADQGPRIQSSTVSSDGCSLSLTVATAAVCNLPPLTVPGGVAFTLTTASVTPTPFPVFADGGRSNGAAVAQSVAGASVSPFAGPNALAALTGTCYPKLPFTLSFFPGSNYSATICLGASVTVSTASGDSLAGTFSNYLLADGNYVGQLFTGGDVCGSSGVQMSAEISLICGRAGSLPYIVSAASDGGPCRFVLALSIAEACGYDPAIGNEGASTSNTPSWSPSPGSAPQNGTAAPAAPSLSGTPSRSVTPTRSETRSNTRTASSSQTPTIPASPSRRPPGGPIVLSSLLDKPLFNDSSVVYNFTNPLTGTAFAVNATWFGTLKLVDPSSPSTVLLDFGSFLGWTTSGGVYSGLIYSGGGTCSPPSGGTAQRSAVVNVQCGSTPSLSGALVDPSNCTFSATAALPELCGLNLFVGQELPSLFSSSPSPTAAVTGTPSVTAAITGTPSTTALPTVTPTALNISYSAYANVTGPWALAHLQGLPLLMDANFTNPVDGSVLSVNVTWFGGVQLLDFGVGGGGGGSAGTTLDGGSFCSWSTVDGKYTALQYCGGSACNTATGGIALRSTTVNFQCGTPTTLTSAIVDAARCTISLTVATPSYCGAEFYVGQELPALTSSTATPSQSPNPTSSPTANATRSFSATISITATPSRRPPGGPLALASLLDRPLFNDSSSLPSFTNPLTGTSFALNASWFGTLKLVDPSSPSTVLLDFGTFLGWVSSGGLYSGLIYAGGGVCSPSSGGTAQRSAVVTVQCGTTSALLAAQVDPSNCTFSATAVLPQLCDVNLFVGQEIPSLFSSTPSPTSAVTETPTAGGAAGGNGNSSGGSGTCAHGDGSPAQGPSSLSVLQGRLLAEGSAALFTNPVTGAILQLNATFFGSALLVDPSNSSVIGNFGSFSTYTVDADGRYSGFAYDGGDLVTSGTNGSAVVRRACVVNFECPPANAPYQNASYIISGVVDAAMTMMSVRVALPEVCGLNLRLGQETSVLYSATPTISVSRSWTPSRTAPFSPTRTRSPTASVSLTGSISITATASPAIPVSASATETSSVTPTPSAKPPTTFVVFNLTIAGCPSTTSTSTSNGGQQQPDPSVRASLISMIANAAGVDPAYVNIDSTSCSKSNSSATMNGGGGGGGGSTNATSVSFSIAIPPSSASATGGSSTGLNVAGAAANDETVVALLSSVAVTNKLTSTFSDPITATAALSEASAAWQAATAVNLDASSLVSFNPPQIRVNSANRLAPDASSCAAGGSNTTLTSAGATDASTPGTVTAAGFVAGFATFAGMALAAAAAWWAGLGPKLAALLNRCGCCRTLAKFLLGAARRKQQKKERPVDVMDAAVGGDGSSGRTTPPPGGLAKYLPSSSEENGSTEGVVSCPIAESPTTPGSATAVAAPIPQSSAALGSIELHKLLESGGVDGDSDALSARTSKNHSSRDARVQVMLNDAAASTSATTSGGGHGSPRMMTASLPGEIAGATSVSEHNKWALPPLSAPLPSARRGSGVRLPPIGASRGDHHHHHPVLVPSAHSPSTHPSVGRDLSDALSGDSTSGEIPFPPLFGVVSVSPELT